MLLVLLLGAGFGYFILRAREQAQTVDVIRRAGGRVVYGWQWRNGRYDPTANSFLPEWLIHRLGPHYFDSVKCVFLSGPIADDEVMAATGLPHYRCRDSLHDLQ
jgi:hypothetical protein